MKPFQNVSLMSLGSCRCWINSVGFNMFHEPPYTEPYVRWCGRTAGATPPPTRLPKYSANIAQSRRFEASGELTLAICLS